jgi:hypothetical protein
LDQLKPRDFITVLGSAAVSWPLVPHAPASPGVRDDVMVACVHECSSPMEATMTITDNRFVALGPGPEGFKAAGEEEELPFGGIMFAESIGLLGVVGDLGLNQQNRYSGHAGVEGVSNDFTGVAGASLNQTGVYGQVEDRPLVPAGLRAGVLGVASTQPGLIGFSRAGDGAQGASFTGTAVRAVSFFGPGVQSISGALSGVTGVSGTEGPKVPDIATTAGVVGTSSDLSGVIGTSKALIGVFGFSNNVGIVGRTTNPNSFAGFFMVTSRSMARSRPP